MFDWIEIPAVVGILTLFLAGLLSGCSARPVPDALEDPEEPAPPPSSRYAGELRALWGGSFRERATARMKLLAAGKAALPALARAAVQAPRGSYAEKTLLGLIRDIQATLTADELYAELEHEGPRRRCAIERLALHTGARAALRIAPRVTGGS